LLSIDGGKAWDNGNTGLDQPNIADVVADPTITRVLYVGSKSGVQRSIDGGRSFVAIDAGLSDREVEALALDAKAAPHVLYAATSSGVFRCKNPESRIPGWTEITPPAMAGHLGDYLLAVDGTTAGRLYVATNLHFAPREIYHSDDYGGQWTATAFHAVTGNDIPLALIADPRSPGTVYAAAEVAAVVYKSTNAGKSFTPILGAEGIQFTWGQGDALNPRTLYLLSTNGYTGQKVILRSTDGGLTWDSEANAAPGGGNLLRLAADPGSSRIYALVRNTVPVGQGQEYTLSLFESPNRGFVWTNIVGNLTKICRPCSAGLNGGFTVPAVTRDPSLWATGNTLAVAAPLAATLFQQNLR
jgi:hypothetical protein